MIEQRGLEEEGLYRVSGAITKVKLLESTLESCTPVTYDDDQWADINVLTVFLKRWLSQIPHELVQPTILEKARVLCGKYILVPVTSAG